MAAPMAVSSCRTLVEFLSLGSTVLEFFMTGKGKQPPFLSNCAFSALRSTQRLFVLKKLCFWTSWNAFSSAAGHCADSRSRRPFALRAKCPPFLSASVRRATSIMKGAPESAKWVRSFKSRTAPRLSELETNMYCLPWPSNRSSVPLPSRAGKRSPCPGGHHSMVGSLAQVTGLQSASVTFGALFCRNSRSFPSPSSGWYFERNSIVSFDVEKESMSKKARSGVNVSRMFFTCRAMRSRNVFPALTSNRDLAFSRPIPVPRPPFSLSTTVDFRSSGLGVMDSCSKSAMSLGWTGVIDFSEIIVSTPDRRVWRLDLKAAMAASVRPSCFNFFSYSGQTEAKSTTGMAVAVVLLPHPPMAHYGFPLAGGWSET
mmetsp:Transcript_671/g.2113  ORF Transcript_671/g.2113 Transcript_671/m.2113 type:complete len:371 (-) Transcript_671:8-1120(-)